MVQYSAKLELLRRFLTSEVRLDFLEGSIEEKLDCWARLMKMRLNEEEIKVY